MRTRKKWRTFFPLYFVMLLLMHVMFPKVKLPPSQNDSPYSQIFCFKIIIPPPESFCPKLLSCFYVINEMICFSIKKTFDTGLDIWGSNLNIFKNQSHHHEDFRHRNLWGCSGVIDIFYFERHTYNYSDNGERGFISPKLEMRTIILGRSTTQGA